MFRKAFLRIILIAALAFGGFFMVVYASQERMSVEDECAKCDECPAPGYLWEMISLPVVTSVH